MNSLLWTLVSSLSFSPTIEEKRGLPWRQSQLSITGVHLL